MNIDNGPIKCAWLEKRTIVVNPDGQVVPCCFAANSLYFNTNNDKKNKNTYMDSLNASYRIYAEELNINNHSLVEILSHIWYVEIFPSILDGAVRSGICNRVCGRR